MVLERMCFALERVLHSSITQYENLIDFLATILRREAPLLHVFDGFLDQYLRRRIDGQPHETAMADLSRIKMPELREDDGADWVMVMPPEELSFQGLHIQDRPRRLYSDCTSPAVQTVCT